MPVCGPAPTRIAGSVEVNGMADVKAAIKKISSTKDGLIKYASGKHLKVRSKGFMVWWKKVEEAASYKIKLNISSKKYNSEDFEDLEVDVIDIPRERAYYAFQDLSYDNSDMYYFVVVEAEDRNGQVIDSVKIKL